MTDPSQGTTTADAQANKPDPGFRVIDRRGEEKPEPEKPKAAEGQAIANQLVTGISGPVSKAEHHGPPLARSQGITGPILVIECPHCMGIIRTIEEGTLQDYAKARPFLFTCPNPQCAEQSMVKRSTIALANQMPNRAMKRAAEARARTKG